MLQILAHRRITKKNDMSGLEQITVEAEGSSPFERVKAILAGLRGVSATSKTTIAITADALIAVAALLLATYIRLGYFAVEGLVVLYPLVAITTVLAFWFAGMYGIVLRFSDGGEVPRLVVAILGASIAFMALMYVIAPTPNPRSLWLIYGVVLLVGAGGIRQCWRLLTGKVAKNRRGAPVAVYGAGTLGRHAARFLSAGDDYNPVYWLDDNAEIQGRNVGQMKVLNPSAESTARLLREAGVETIFLAVPSSEGRQLKDVLERVQGYNCSVKSVPPMSEFLANRVTTHDLRALRLEDLIGRPAIAPQAALMEPNITGKVVMVTGAGGSVGGELCRQISLLKPAALLLFEISEPSLYHIEMELREAAVLDPSKLKAVLGSVTDRQKLDSVIAHFGVQTMFHAAAYKHVPLIEQNPAAGAEVNIKGTEAAVDAAVAGGLETFVLISTDKAVRPSSMMGATKRVAELVVQAKADHIHDTKLCIVRFGNVIGSSGSVIPRFQKQIEHGGPVTVTHKDVNRFFMSIPEAAQLVIQAGTLAENGDLLLLDMGEPVKITEIARSLIYLHGLTVKDEVNPRGDIEISFTGLRPGEKLTEELLIDDSSTSTPHPKIVRAREQYFDWDDLVMSVARIYSHIDDEVDDHIRDAVFTLAFSGASDDSGMPPREVTHRLAAAEA